MTIVNLGQFQTVALISQREALGLYRELLGLVEGKLIAMEEFARQMIQTEEMHAAEVDKMLRKPGELTTSSSRAK